MDAEGTGAGSADLQRFVHGEVDAAQFPHREHVRMAFEMLRRHDFPETALLYSRALQAMTTRAGKPEAFNQTLTVAFLALIGERMAISPTAEFAHFERENHDLFEKSILGRWYPPRRASCGIARRTFVLPEPRLPGAGDVA